MENKDYELGQARGQAEAYKHAFDELIKVAINQNKTITTTEKFYDEPFSLDDEEIVEEANKNE